jgi:hypothetical protein
MSNSERFAADTARPSAELRPEPCMALQLEGALSAIAEHLSDLDRRQSEALQGMQSRLAGLGARADALRPEIPSEFAAAFERIQGGVQMLADRLASFERADGEARPSRPAEANRNVTAATRPAATVSPRSTAAFVEEAMREAPAPLRSASPATPRADRQRPSVDPFGFTEDDEPDRGLDAKLAGIGRSLANERTTSPGNPPSLRSGSLIDPITPASDEAAGPAEPASTGTHTADPDGEPWDTQSAEALAQLLAPLPP